MATWVGDDDSQLSVEFIQALTAHAGPDDGWSLASHSAVQVIVGGLALRLP